MTPTEEIQEGVKKYDKRAHYIARKMLQLIMQLMLAEIPHNEAIDEMARCIQLIMIGRDDDPNTS